MNLWSEHQHGHRKNLVTAPQHKRGALFGDIVVDVGNSKRVKEGGTNSSDEVSEGGTDTVPVFLSRLWSIIILMMICGDVDDFHPINIVIIPAQSLPLPAPCV